MKMLKIKSCVFDKFSWLINCLNNKNKSEILIRSYQYSMITKRIRINSDNLLVLIQIIIIIQCLGFREWGVWLLWHYSQVYSDLKFLGPIYGLNKCLKVISIR